jgi:8-amino-7-oxononanoate synthase
MLLPLSLSLSLSLDIPPPSNTAELGEYIGQLVPAAAFFAFESPRALARAPGLLTGDLDIDEGAGAGSVAVGMAAGGGGKALLAEGEAVPSEWSDISAFAEYQGLRAQIDAMESGGLTIPYLRELKPGSTEVNYNTYNYLGLAKLEEVKDASVAAVVTYGTSMSSSPIVGQPSVNVQLEKELVSFMGTEAAVVFIGGWQANVTTIDVLVGPGDLVLCDTLNHNCCVVGQKLSGATIMPFPHNDFKQADKILTAVRRQFRRVLIVIEGVYSMDGDIPDLPAFVALKKKHSALLYVDEAHSLGTLGATGHGICEHFGVAPTEVDVLMGTLSKAMGSCGGFIAGSKALVELLKFTAGGFVFSCGATPAAAAAALTALRVLQREPERVTALRARARLFTRLAAELGLDTGRTMDGAPVIPVVIGGSHKCVALSQVLAEQDGINVKPIVYPAVEENQARLRFFMSYLHTEEQIEHTVRSVARRLAEANKK